ncbi:MAG: tetratricopeptide repeat protein [Nitrospinae bacterium]|nr:tetratricopeptide repeat protein [Nitrospinota bacterium]
MPTIFSQGMKKIDPVWAVLFLALATRAVYFWEYRANPFFDYIYPDSDSINFDQGARQFASGDWLAPSFNNSYSPLYKYFLGLVYKVAGRNLPLAWAVQFLLGAVTVALIFLIARRLFNPPAAWSSAVLYNFYGPALMYEGLMLRESLGCFLGALSFHFLLGMKERRDRFHLTLTGLAISLFIQCRPNVVLVFIAAVPFLMHNAKKADILDGFRLAGIAALFSIPLLIQTYLVHKKFVFFDASGTLTFVFGNRPDYPGAGFQNAHEIYGKSYAEALRLFLSDFVNRPLDMALLYVRKTYFFINAFEYPSNYYFDIFREFSGLLRNPLSDFSIMSALGLAGMVLGFREFRRLRILYAYAVGMSLSVIAFYYVSRLRIPAVPYFALFAGLALSRVWLWARASDYRTAGMVLGVSLLLKVLLNSPVEVPPGEKSNHYGNLGMAYLRLGETDKAKASIEKSLVIQPDNVYGHINLGTVYARTGKLNEAYLEFLAAVRINPGFWEAHFNLGLILERAGQFEKAGPELQTALALRPGDPGILFHLGKVNGELGRHEQAAEYLRRSLAANPASAQAYFVLGMEYAAMQQHDASIGAFNQAVALDPEFPKAYNNMGVVYEKLGRHAEAAQAFRAALRIDPGFAEARNNLSAVEQTIAAGNRG